jgi:formylmethanofuran dehydrogenase subunit E
LKPFKQLLEESVRDHGHLCPGQVLGVRMAILGLKLLGLDPDNLAHLKRLITFVEVDRCAADAIASVTGCKLGRRSLKFKDYGLMAATFLDLETELAYRVTALETSRELAPRFATPGRDRRKMEVEAYSKMSLEDLFRIERVRVHLSELDLPGPARKKTACAICGELVRDGKEVIRDGKTLCRPCSGDSYFEIVEDINIGADAALS